MKDMLAVERIIKVLDHHDFRTEDDHMDESGNFHVTIEGDWKHDHLRLLQTMHRLGYRAVAEKVYDSDSDWYKADYVFADELMEDDDEI